MQFDVNEHGVNGKVKMKLAMTGCPDADGKVSVERTKIAGMTDHIVLRATHPFITRNRVVIRQTVEFLRTGRFDHSGSGTFPVR